MSHGATMLELDCHLSRDGHVVVSHDDDLERVSGWQVRIAETNLGDLPRLRRKIRLHFEQEAFFEGKKTSHY